MTEEEINIAIAEACGLFKIEPLRRTTRKGKTDPNGVVLWYCEEHHGGAATYARVPDYCNDLNAMHSHVRSRAGRRGARAVGFSRPRLPRVPTNRESAFPSHRLSKNFKSLEGVNHS